MRCTVAPSGKEEHPQLAKLVEWVEENADAEEVEKGLGRCLAAASAWVKEMVIGLQHFDTAEEIAIWETVLYTGLEACIPIDGESELMKLQNYNDVPPVPLLFTSQMSVAAMEEQLALVNVEVEGVEPSSTGQSKAATPKKANTYDPTTRTAALDAFKEAATTESIKKTGWLDTYKTCVQNPFVLFRARRGVGACDPRCVAITARMALHFLWTEKVPGLEGARWGKVRKGLVNLVIAQHPHLFSNASLQALPIANAIDFTLKNFVAEFSRWDAASQFSDLPEHSTMVSNAEVASTKY